MLQLGNELYSGTTFVAQIKRRGLRFTHVRRATLGEVGRLTGAWGAGLVQTTETRRRNALESYF